MQVVRALIVPDDQINFGTQPGAWEKRSHGATIPSYNEDDVHWITFTS